MLDTSKTIFKILLISTFITFLIKYGGRLLSPSPSFFNVMIAVFLPALMMAGVFIWRWNSPS